jgi:hypothetical protein
LSGPPPLGALTCGFARDEDRAYKPICGDAFPRSIGGAVGAWPARPYRSLQLLDLEFHPLSLTLTTSP